MTVTQPVTPAATSRFADHPRSVALNVGAARYFTGVPCASSHVTERYTVDGNCVECRRLSNAAQKQRVRELRANR